MLKFIKGFYKTIDYYKFLNNKTEKIINDNKWLLIDGVYKSNATNSIIFNKKFKNFVLQEKKFVWRENCKKSIVCPLHQRIALLLFSFFFRKRIKVGNDNLNNKCQVIILSTLDVDIKFINYKNAEIITVFKNADRMNFILNQRSLWGGRKVPIIEINRDKFLLKEKFIEKREYRHKDGFDFILNQVSDLLLSKKTICENFKMTEENLKKAEAYILSGSSDKSTKLLNDFRFFLKSGSYKKCICHGDLYYNNLIFDGKDFYYIDFEMVDKHFFMFDLLFYAFFESFRFYDDSFLIDYFNGKYDEKFELIFKKNDIQFLTELKTTYLFVVLYEYYGANIPIEFREKYLF